VIHRIWSLLRRRGTAGRAATASEGAFEPFIDYLESRAKPRALHPSFKSIFKAPLAWERAPGAALKKLPLDKQQRDQYDTLFTSRFGDRALYLLESRHVYYPDIPFIPSYLLLGQRESDDQPKPIGEFDILPDHWATMPLKAL
jgi:hypothetical protein